MGKDVFQERDSNLRPAQLESRPSDFGASSSLRRLWRNCAFNTGVTRPTFT